MKFPNWLKIMWWIISLVLCLVILILRKDIIIYGTPSNFDIMIFIIFTGIFLSPIFAEFEIWGLKIKNQFDEIKSEIKQFENFINNKISLSSTINPQFNISHIPADNVLPDLETKIKALVNDYYRNEVKVQVEDSEPSKYDVSEEVKYLFSVRFNLERLLRSIYSKNINSDLDTSKRISLIRMARELAAKGPIDIRFLDPIIEIYHVCSPAVHGFDVSENQLKFVKATAYEVLNYLDSIDSFYYV